MPRLTGHDTDHGVDVARELVGVVPRPPGMTQALAVQFARAELGRPQSRGYRGVHHLLHVHARRRAHEARYGSDGAFDELWSGALDLYRSDLITHGHTTATADLVVAATVQILSVDPDLDTIPWRP